MIRDARFVLAMIGLHHFWQGVLLSFDPSTGGITSIATLHRALVSIDFAWASATLLVTAGVLGIIAGMMPGRVLMIAAALPQQLVLMVAAVGAVAAMFTQTFPDGVPRSFGFIAADQSVYIGLVALHFWAMLTGGWEHDETPEPRGGGSSRRN